MSVIQMTPQNILTDPKEFIDSYFDKTIKVRKYFGMHVLHLNKFITGA